MSNYIHHVSDTQIETKSENLSTNDTNIFEDYENICKNSTPELSGVGELPSYIRIKNFSSNDSMPFDEAYKTNFQNEETAYNSLQNNEIELKEDQQRYFHTKTLEELKTKSDIIPSNNSNSRIFTTTKDEKNNSKKELLHKKRGRKVDEKNEKNAKNKKKKKTHDKYKKDNALRKIQVHYINFIIKFLNIILLLFNYNKKEKFYLIDHDLKKVVNEEYSEYLKTLKLADIAQMKISPKCNSIEDNNNITLYKKIKNNPYINNILEENYLSFFQNVYYRSERKINLNKYGIIEDIILSDDIKMYSDIIKSFEDKDNISMIQTFVNHHYFNNKLFFHTEKEK